MDSTTSLVERCIACCCVLLDTRGVFKAHKPCDETRDAEEVKDSDDTVHDIPVDLQDAVTVEVSVTWVLCQCNTNIKS